jgi:MFS family permease
MKKILGRGGPLGVFHEYPALLQLGIICCFAETAWATLLLVMEFYFKEELLRAESPQYIASKIAVAFLAFAGAETLFKYPMGALADKYGPRRFVFLALGICSVTPLLVTYFAFTTGAWWVFIPLRILDGIAAAALWPSMSALMNRAVPACAKSAAMSVFNAAYVLGLAVGPTTGLLLGHKLGTNVWVFPFCALLMILGAIVALRSISPQADVQGFHGESLGEDKALLRGRPMLWRMMGLYALSQMGVGILAPTVPVYIESQFHLKQGDLPQLLVFPALLVVAVAIPLGRLPDTIGKAKSVWISYILAACGMLLIALTSLFEPTKTLFSLPVAMFGLGISAMIISYILGTPAWLGLTSLQVDNTKQAQAMSLMQTAQGFGVVCAFALVGSAGHLMTTMQKVSAHLKHEDIGQVAAVTKDAFPLSIWFWLATIIFVLCLIGTLLFVREIEDSENNSSISEHPDADAANQPLEIKGI